jgi:hypothetical protein
MSDKDYIPKNVYDIAAVERLKKLPFESVREDVPALLEWLQDGHWDIAGEMRDYLLPYINIITHELIFILNTEDSVWKSFVICGLIALSPHKLEPSLIEVLKRIAEHPSKFDAENGLDEAAKGIITNKVLCG